MDGLTFNKLLVVGLIAAFLIGPERLPALADGLAKLVKKSKSWLKESSKNISEEFGDEGVDALEELKKFDPRKFDPRRIIVNAWLSDEDSSTGNMAAENLSAGAGAGDVDGSGRASGSAVAAGAAGMSAARERQRLLGGAASTPFDDEAT